MHELRRIAEGRRQCPLAFDDRFHLGDLSIANLDAHGVVRRLAMLLDRAEPGGIAGRRVRNLQSRGGYTRNGIPDAFVPDRHFHVVFRESDIRSELGAAGVLVHQRIQIAVQRANQTGVVAVARNDGAAQAGSLGECRDGDSLSGEQDTSGGEPAAGSGERNGRHRNIPLTLAFLSYSPRG